MCTVYIYGCSISKQVYFSTWISVQVQRACITLFNLVFLIILMQAHNDLIKTYESKLTSFGIPTEELGFKPLQSTVTGQTLGEGPAGLVAAPL